MLMRILLIEDDAMVGEALCKNLAQNGHAVDWIRNGLQAIAHWRTTNYDIVLLDLGLPGRDGMKILADARRSCLNTPVLILTARDSIEARIDGLDVGADDFLVKPFDMNELSARIRAVYRRRAGRAQSTIEYRGLNLDFSTRTGRYLDREVLFTRREFALLSTLLEQPGRVWTKEQLVARMYGWGEGIASNSLEFHVHQLRRKLALDFIGNAHGVGYFVRKEPS